MPSDLDPTAGFDVALDMTDAEAFQEELDRLIGSAAADADFLFTTLSDAARGHVNTASAAEAQLRAGLHAGLERRLKIARGVASELAAPLGSLAADLTIEAGREAQSLALLLPKDTPQVKRDVEFVCCSGAWYLRWNGAGFYDNVTAFLDDNGLPVFQHPIEGEFVGWWQPKIPQGLVDGGAWDLLFHDKWHALEVCSLGGPNDICRLEGSGNGKPEPPEPPVSETNGNGECPPGLDFLPEKCKELLSCFTDLLNCKPRKLWLDCDTGLLSIARDGEQPEGAVEVQTEDGVDLDELCKQCEQPGPPPNGNGNGNGNGEDVNGGFFAVPDDLGLRRGEPDPCMRTPASISQSVRNTVFGTIYAAGGISGVTGALNALTDLLKMKLPSSGPLTIFSMVLFLARSLQEKISKLNCEGLGGPIFDLESSRTIMQWLNIATMGSFDRHIEIIDQTVNFRCPIKRPSPSESLSAFLANTMTARELECNVKSFGLTWDKQWEYVADGARTKPGFLDLAVMHRRGRIDRELMFEKARELGYTNDRDVSHLFAITEQVPPVSDLTRMMVRDVADEVNIDWRGADDLFVQKWTGKLKDWGDDQGVPEDMMKMIWRAHFRIPSPTQLYTWLHRFGREPAGTFKPDILKRVRGALIQDDILPEWVQPLIDISFSLPRVTQISKLFKSGLFTKQQVVEEFYKRGLETKTAEALAEDVVRSTNKAWATHRVVKDYAAGETNLLGMEQALRREGATDDGVAEAKFWAVYERNTITNKECLKAIKHRVMMGELNLIAAIIEIDNMVNDTDLANDLAKRYFCERDSRSKSISAAPLCSLYKDGIISKAEFLDRLITLNYTPEAADMLVTRCDIQLKKTIAKAEQLEAKRLLQRRQRELKQALANTRREESQRRTTTRATEASRKARVRREELLLKISKRLGVRMGLAIPPVYTEVLGTFNRLQRRGLGRADEIVKASTVVASDNRVQDIAEWEDQVIDVLLES